MNGKAKAFACALLAVAVVGAVCASAVGSKRYYEYAYGEEATVETAAVKQGSKGDVVKQIQQKLKRWGYYGGSVDGIFGSATKKAVIYFQRKNGLTPDGIVGAKTLAALGISTSSGTATGSSTYSSSDTNLLARLIYAEARGETYTGKVAVGAGSEQSKICGFPQHYIGRYLSALRVYVRFGRSDKPFAGRFGVVGGKRRHERLGSVLRQFILL